MRPMTKSTERRVPRITGLPARTAESSTMRAGSAMVSPRARLPATVLSHLLEPPIVALPQPERSFACGHDVTKKMKGGFCVSTVSIVCGRAPGSMAVGHYASAAAGPAPGDPLDGSDPRRYG